MEHREDRDLTLYVSLRELTHIDSEDGLKRRLFYEVEDTNWSETERSRVYQLVDLVTDQYHYGDPRDDKTYATHVLRVTTRLLSVDHFNARQSPDMIIAALLHDVIEDRPERLLDELPLNKAEKSPENLTARRNQRARAIAVIAAQYGPSVANMVWQLSNGIYDSQDMTTDEKHRHYQAHVRHLLEQGGDTALIKLSDFVDNCLGLEFNPDEKHSLKLAAKYKPLIAPMFEFVYRSGLDDEIKAKLANELVYANEICNAILASEGARTHLNGFQAPWFGSDRTKAVYEQDMQTGGHKVRAALAKRACMLAP